MSKKRIKQGLLPLTYKNDGWRIVLPNSLEFYDFLPAGRKLLELSVYDNDMNGGYYWIPVSDPPKGGHYPCNKANATLYFCFF